MAQDNRLFSRILFIGLTVFVFTALMQVPAVGQSACEQLGVDCHITIHGRPDSSDDNRSSSDRSNAADAWEYYWLGNEHLRAGNYQSAVDAYKKARRLSYLTIHAIDAHDLRRHIGPKLQGAEQALKAQREGRLWKPGTASNEATEKESQAASVTQMRQSLNQFATSLSSSTSTSVGLDFAGSQSRKDGTASTELTFMDSAAVAKREEEKRRQEELRNAKTYSVDTIKVPVPQIVRSEISYKGTRIILSDKASRFVEILKENTEKLPQPTREQIRNAIYEYIRDHALPENERTVWNIDKGLINDINEVFEAMKRDLANRDLSFTETQQTDDKVLPNTQKRVEEATRDRALESIKDALGKYLANPSERSPDE